MNNSLINDAASLVQQLPGQSRYRVDVHECPEFLDVLKFSSVESLSKPWRYDISVTCSTPDIASAAVLLKTCILYFSDPDV